MIGDGVHQHALVLGTHQVRGATRLDLIDQRHEVRYLLCVEEFDEDLHRSAAEQSDSECPLIGDAVGQNSMCGGPSTRLSLGKQFLGMSDDIGFHTSPGEIAGHLAVVEDDHRRPGIAWGAAP
nr:hypothetical protein [Gordonia desulfuricans]